jgi:hypothetical protein
MRHQADKRDVVQADERCRQPFVGPRQAAETRGPGEAAFDDPTPWQEDEIPLRVGERPHTLLLYVTRSVAELPERAVDERQEAIRNHAYRQAHRIITHALLWPVGLVVVLAAFGDPFGWLHALWSNTALVIALGTSGTQLLAFLPTMILAWVEPDPIEGEWRTDEPPGEAIGLVI